MYGRINEDDSTQENPIRIDFHEPQPLFKYPELISLLRSDINILDPRGNPVEVLNQNGIFQATNEEGKTYWFSPAQDVIRIKRKHPNAEKGAYSLHSKDVTITSGGQALIHRVSNLTAKHSRIVKILLPSTFKHFPRAAEMEEKYGKHTHAKAVKKGSGGERYVVMDYLGSSLQDILDADKDGTRKLSDRERILIGIAIATAYQTQVIQQGIVHQDIKPANIMVDLEKLENAFDLDTTARSFPVKIIDFATAKEMGDSDTPSPFTKGYNPPEVMESFQPTNTGSDIYALGVTLAQVFKAQEPSFKTFIYEKYVPENLFKDLDLPRQNELSAIIEAMIDENPTKRPENLQDLRDALIETYKEKESVQQDQRFVEPDASFWKKPEIAPKIESTPVKPEPPQPPKGFWDQHGETIVATSGTAAGIGSLAGTAVGILITLGVAPVTFGLSAFLLPITIPAGAAAGAGLFGAIGFTGSLLWNGIKHLRQTKKSAREETQISRDNTYESTRDAEDSFNKQRSSTLTMGETMTRQGTTYLGDPYSHHIHRRYGTVTKAAENDHPTEKTKAANDSSFATNQTTWKPAAPEKEEGKGKEKAPSTPTLSRSNKED